MSKDIISKDKLLEAGVYFGHRRSTWNPKMKPYIATSKKGVHIMDVDKTKKTLEFAYGLVKSYAEKGASFVFVGTRKQAKETIKQNALRTNSFYVTERWLGGTLTNNRTIFKRVYRMFELEKLAEQGFPGYTKKEGLLLQRELDKLQKNLSGIKTMKQKPNVMIVADPAHDDIAVKEAKRMGVKVIGIVDTNNDPNSVHIAIPGNDDSVKSVTLIMTILADAIAAAKNGKQEYAFQPDSAIVLPDEPKREFKPRRSFGGPRRDFKPRGDRPQRTEGAEPKVRKANAEVEAAPKTEPQDLSALKVAELKELAEKKNIEGFKTMKKDELIKALA